MKSLPACEGSRIAILERGTTQPGIPLWKRITSTNFVAMDFRRKPESVQRRVMPWRIDRDVGDDVVVGTSTSVSTSVVVATNKGLDEILA
jgi:hypothetical protein